MKGFSRYIAVGVSAAVILCGAFWISAETTEKGKEQGPLWEKREELSIQWLVPSKGSNPKAVPDWAEGFGVVRAQMFQEPDVKSKPVGVLEAKVRREFIDIRKDASGKPQWVQLKNQQGVLGWVEARYLSPRAEGLIINPYEGVDYGPIAKNQGYPGNPRVKVKGIYLTVNSASGANLDTLIQLADETEINAFVIDVKDDYGQMLFHTQAASLYCPEANLRAPVSDIHGLIKKLKDHHIYTIARIVTFKTPNYALKYPGKAILDTSTGGIYQSRDGLYWASAFDRQLWRYNVEVAKEAAEAGFNEIQFDYVRFPDIKPSVDVGLNYRNTYKESKAVAIYRFLRFAREQLEPYRVYLAADTFGWTASATNDVNIGQHWESVSNVLDYDCPMIYPSHYGPGNFGFAVPDAHPYETIRRAVGDAQTRNQGLLTPGVLRPWIQDFTAKWVPGHISYGPEEVRAQIQALEDSGVDEYLLWNAANRYTRGALKGQ